MSALSMAVSLLQVSCLLEWAPAQPLYDVIQHHGENQIPKHLSSTTTSQVIG
jgi:hypothetical protein